MHINKSHLFGAATLAIALSLAASPVSAHEATFQLPFPVQLGNNVLQPGEYRMTMPSLPSPVGAIYLYGAGKVRVTVPITVGTQQETDRSYLELVNVGGTYFVRQFVSGELGKTYTFGVPKMVRHEVLANSTSTTVAVTGGAAN